MRYLLFILTAVITIVTSCQTNKNNNMFKQEIKLTQTWDKTFPLSEKVYHEKVTFKTNYGFTLAADLYIPKVSNGKMPAIAICGPYGAVKEQVSGRYAMVMAERGYITIAFDPSFTGESSGEPRYTSSPDINTEDFMAAIDYLITRDDVDVERIGICGICGWGGIALNTAAIDTRIKATLAVTMYDMARVNCNGYNDIEDNESARYAKREAASRQRTIEARSLEHKRVGGVIKTPSDDTPQFLKDYSAYYATERGFHERSLGSTEGWNAIGQQAYLNTRFLQFTNEIRSAVLLIHGEKAHSRYFSEGAFEYMMEGNPNPSNKELYIVSGAVHCDLYDGGKPHSAGDDTFIPWNKIETFFETNL